MSRPTSVAEQAGKPVTLTARLTLKGEHVATLEEWIGQELQRSHGRVKDERILFSGNAAAMPAVQPGGKWVVQQKRSRLPARLSAHMHAMRLDARAFAASMRKMVGRPQHQIKQNKKLNKAPENGQKTHRFVWR